jgi:hypothetical protein
MTKNERAKERETKYKNEREKKEMKRNEGMLKRGKEK